MSVRTVNPAWRALLALAVLALVGCDNRVRECNGLIAVINAAEDADGGRERQADAESFRRFASDLDAVTKRLDSLELHLEPVRAFRDRYRTIVGDYARALRTLAEAQEAADGEKVRSLIDQGNALERDSSKLMADLNAYCGGK